MNPRSFPNDRSTQWRCRAIGGLLALGLGFGAAIFLVTRDVTLLPADTPASANVSISTTGKPEAIPASEIPLVVSSPTAISRPTVDAIQELATRDHWRALALALAESDPEYRAELLQALLRGWASTDADAAADWARAQPYLESGQAFAAVFNGANRHPEDAVRLGRRLSEADPENAGSYAGYLIFALSQVEKFELAANVATSSAPELRTDLLTAAFNQWGERQPARALSAAAELKEPETQRAAFQAALGGWARANPRELTEVAINLPDGPDRRLALTTALRHWIERDPAAVAEWAAHAKSFPEMEASLEE